MVVSLHDSNQLGNREPSLTVSEGSLLLLLVPVAGDGRSSGFPGLPQAHHCLTFGNLDVLLFPAVFAYNTVSDSISRSPVAGHDRSGGPLALPEAENHVAVGNLNVLPAPASVSDCGGVICGVRRGSASGKEGDDDESDEDSECLTHDDSS